MSDEWDGKIPAFDPGHYELDEHGVFYSTLYSTDDRSQATQGRKPSNVLRRYLMYRQRGLCASCRVPEWALSRSLHVHRLDKTGLYSIHNTELLCRKCHAGVHHGTGAE